MDRSVKIILWKERAKISDELSKPAIEALEFFREAGTDGIILGCTEIPILLGEYCNDHDIINPSQLVASEAIRRALN